MPDLIHGHVAHVVPGRIRIKLHRADLTDALSAKLQSAFAGMPEVDAVRMQPATGSVTLYHGDGGLSPADLADRLSTAPRKSRTG